jgi:hypothetical protein
VSIAGKVVIAQVIGHDENDIGTFLLAVHRASGSEDEEEQ